MNKEYKLTIAIPTYNRKRELRECLDNVIAQNNSMIEIIVVDNASTDGTKELMKCYSDVENLVYYRAKENKGVDYNIFRCLSIARGEYVQLLADDDVVLEGAINRVLKFVKDYNPDLVHLNNVAFEKKYDKNKKYIPRLIPKKDGLISSKDKFMKEVGDWVTFLSSLIIKKEKFEIIKKKKNYLGTNMFQSHIFLLISGMQNAKIGIIYEPCIAMRGGNSGGYNIYRVWLAEYKKLLLKTGILVGYNRKQMKKLYTKFINDDMPMVIYSSRLQKKYIFSKKVAYIIFNTFPHFAIGLKLILFSILPLSVLDEYFIKISSSK